MTARLCKSLLAAVLLQVVFFALYFVLQPIGYRHLFGYMAITLLLLSLAVALLMALTGPFLIKKLVADPYERRLVALLATFGFIGCTNFYNIMFPVSLERSFSVRILVNLAQAQGELTKDELEKYQTKDAIYNLRYNEMLGSGLIRIENNKIFLTDKGKMVAGAYVGLAKFIGYSNSFKCAAMAKCED